MPVEFSGYTVRIGCGSVGPGWGCCCVTTGDQVAGGEERRQAMGVFFVVLF